MNHVEENNSYNSNVEFNIEGPLFPEIHVAVTEDGFSILGAADMLAQTN